MTLSYDANLEDMSAPSIRQFLRSDSARRGRYWSTLRGAILVAAVYAFIFREQSMNFIIAAIVIGLLIGGMLNFFTYIPTVKRRVKKYVKKTTEGRLPAKTTYIINNGRVACTCMEVTTSFSLSHLEDVSESDGRLELYFGQRGLCAIPLRVFNSEESKVAFINKIHSEQDAAANP